MYIKNFFLVSLLLLSGVPWGLHAQSISMDIISSGGHNFRNERGSLSWTIGEVATETIGSQQQLTQGFQQYIPQTKPYVLTTALRDLSKTKNWEVQLFPNPILDHVNIRFVQASVPLDMLLINSAGQQIMHRKMDMSGQIDLERLAPGHYFLYFFDQEKNHQSIKIQKLP